MHAVGVYCGTQSFHTSASTPLDYMSKGHFDGVLANTYKRMDVN